MAKKIKTIIIALILAVPLLVASSAFADPPCKVTGGCAPPVSADCNTPNPTATQIQNCVKNDSIVKDLNTIVNVLSAIVGVVIVGVMVLGGIQYSAAGDNPGAIGAAKQRITNGLIALVAFLLTYAFLQWIIPGGVFS